MAQPRTKWGVARAILIGAGAALGLTGLGMDVSVSLSTYGLYLGEYGPFLVISGVPIFLNVVFALVLLRTDQGLIRYSMVVTAIAASLIIGFLVFVGLFQGLIGGG